MGFPEGCPEHCNLLPAPCPLLPSRLSLLFPLIPQTVSVLKTFRVSNRMLFSKQNRSHSKRAQIHCHCRPLGRPGAVTLTRTTQPHSIGSSSRLLMGRGNCLHRQNSNKEVRINYGISQKRVQNGSLHGRADSVSGSTVLSILGDSVRADSGEEERKQDLPWAPPPEGKDQCTSITEMSCV